MIFDHFSEEKVPDYYSDYFFVRRFSSFKKIHSSFRGRPILRLMKRFAREGKMCERLKKPYSVYRHCKTKNGYTLCTYQKTIVRYVLYWNLFQKSTYSRKNRGLSFQFFYSL